MQQIRSLVTDAFKYHPNKAFLSVELVLHHHWGWNEGAGVHVPNAGNNPPSLWRCVNQLLQCLFCIHITALTVNGWDRRCKTVISSCLALVWLAASSVRVRVSWRGTAFSSGAAELRPPARSKSPVRSGRKGKPAINSGPLPCPLPRPCAQTHNPAVAHTFSFHVHPHTHYPEAFGSSVTAQTGHHPPLLFLCPFFSLFLLPFPPLPVQSAEVLGCLKTPASLVLSLLVWLISLSLLALEWKHYHQQENLNCVNLSNK